MGPEAEIRRLPDLEKRKVLALIAGRARVRFGLTADTFADHLLDLVGRGGEPVEGRLDKLGLDDLYLATACARGDEKAWKEFGDRYFGFIRDFAHRYLPKTEASELADEVIVDLWQRKKLGRYQGRSALKTWLGAVVAHAALNALKSHRSMVSRRDEQLNGGRRRGADVAREDAAADAEASAFGLLASEALARLEAEDKLLVLLHYEQGLTLDKIGVAIRLSKTVVSRRLKRVREALRQAMESIAHQRWGTSAEALRQGIDLSRMELDLERLLGGKVERQGPRAV